MAHHHALRIREIVPHLELNTVETVDPDSADDVVIVNGELVFRFLRGEQTDADFAAEVGVTDLIRDRIHLDLPNPFYAENGVIAYKKLEGEAFDEALVRGLSEGNQRSVADQMAGMLKAVHEAPLHIFKKHGLRPTAAPERAAWIGYRADFIEKVAPALSGLQRAQALGLFESVLHDNGAFHYEPCLIHGDLKPQYLLYDARSKQLKSVDGWSKAGLGDPALDIALVMLRWNGAWVVKFQHRYTAVEALMKRAHVYLQAFALQRAFVAAQSGDVSFFTRLSGKTAF